MPIRVYFLNLRRKQKIAAVVLGICLLLALAGAAFWLCIPIPAGVTADGLSLSGLSYLHARTLLKQELDKTLYTQPLKIALPEETLTLSPEDCGVKVSLSGVLKAARGMKQGGEISLRPYLRAKEDPIREILEAYAARHDTQYRETEWHLEGAAPNLGTDLFNPDAPGQTLVVTIGLPTAHLDVGSACDAVMDTFARAVSLCGRQEYVLNFAVTPEKVPEKPDSEELYQEVYAAPVNDAPNVTTGSVLPGAYGQSIDKSALEAALAGAKYGQTLSIPLTYTAPALMGEDALFQDVLGEYETKHNTNENRNNNLRLLCQALNGYVLQPGETFSYNQVVGERTAERGYLPAPAYSGNRLTDAIGGGVCQGSTTLYNCVLLADLEVVFRACHGAKVTYVPAGLDATVNYLTTDFQFRNQFHCPVKILAEVSDGYVKMKLLGTDEKDYYVKMETRSGEDDLAVYARSYKCKFDKKTDELLSREIEAYSTYYKNIG